jgi:hypothetical protein
MCTLTKLKKMCCCTGSIVEQEGYVAFSAMVRGCFLQRVFGYYSIEFGRIVMSFDVFRCRLSNLGYLKKQVKPTPALCTYKTRMWRAAIVCSQILTVARGGCRA